MNFIFSVQKGFGLITFFQIKSEQCELKKKKLGVKWNTLVNGSWLNTE